MTKRTFSKGEISVETVCKILDDHKALDVSVINLSDKTSFADFMVVASGTSQRHLCALGDHLEKGAKDVCQVKQEGSENSDWILVDLGSVIVHLFRPETRQMYDLESMWTMPMLVNAK
ncbi:MAG: ribosome silencing factor [Holosporaceae bacterium]|nr:MAG: ribosome silencing factor [Holosporaceae bacterium]